MLLVSCFFFVRRGTLEGSGKVALFKQTSEIVLSSKRLNPSVNYRVTPGSGKKSKQKTKDVRKKWNNQLMSMRAKNSDR